MLSGIYAQFGPERKDVITEATAQEFRDWLAIKGLNISFMSDDTLDGFFMGHQEPFRQWEIRTAFIADAEAKGITVYKVVDDWEAFKAAYREESQELREETILELGPVTILVGDHKGEPGVIIRKTGYRCYEVLTLAGHSHVYQVNQVRV